MTVAQLASQEDVEAVLGRDLTTDEVARVNAILDKASELFRAEAQRQFTGGTAENIFRVLGGTVYLNERPVISVESVIDDRTEMAVTVRSRYGNRLRLYGCRSGLVRVAYTYEPIVPDLVRLTIAEIAKKVLAIPAEAASGASSTMRVSGPYTNQDSYATWAQGGQTMLAPDDIAIARRFRTKTYAPVVQHAPAPVGALHVPTDF